MTESAFAGLMRELATRRALWEKRSLRDLFAADPRRFAAFSLAADGWLLDFSKIHVEAAELSLLTRLAEAAGLSSWRDRLFAGERINESESRAVLHWALRDLGTAPLVLDGRDVRPDIRAERDRALAAAERIRCGDIKGATGKPFRRIVNIGIGGSDLGPAMTVEALRAYRASDLDFRFVANIDPAHLEAALVGADPETILFLISSKTFTTAETLANAQAAKDWLIAHLPRGAEGSAHFWAITAAPDRARAFGIEPDRVFRFWDWVGGRYSIWSAIGLPLMIAIGGARFRDFLAGAEAMDRHFREAPFVANLPVALALIGFWYRNFWNLPALAILPYAQDLARFPAYLQQLEMESNGKSVTRAGTPALATAPVIWGEPGTNGQHAFHQWLHQGTSPILCDFLLAARPAPGRDQACHRALVAHALAQSQALAFGRDRAASAAEMAAAGLAPAEIERLLPWRQFPGNRPSVTLMAPEFDPYRLGGLIALYEHKVFVQGVLWHINSFDQWGVELGKTLAADILAGKAGDSSTEGLIAYYDAHR